MPPSFHVKIPLRLPAPRIAAAVTLLAVLRMYQRTLAVRARQAFRASRQHSRGGLLPLLRRVIARQRLRDGIPQREDPIGPDAVRVAVLNADQLPRDLVHRNPVAERETDEPAYAFQVGLDHAAGLGDGRVRLERLPVKGIDGQVHLAVNAIDRDRFPSHPGWP